VTPKRLSIAVATVAVAVVLIVGLAQLGSSPSATAPLELTVAQMRARLAGSPPQLAALHAQASAVLPGGLPALRARLAALRGTPIVINKWASWCEPCKAEFGVFQRVSISQGRSVAFIGIDSGENARANAVEFLRSHPVSYPSYYDSSGQAGLTISDSNFTPVTVFYNRSGGKFIYQGPFASVPKLEQDIKRYALDG
jgi:cytochrome c biogenesis protein CcmG, thiol:disulfide interchange protein DsbE